MKNLVTVLLTLAFATSVFAMTSDKMDSNTSSSEVEGSSSEDMKGSEGK